MALSRISVARLLLATALALVALMVPAAVSMAAGPDHPLPPAGYHPDLTPPPGVAMKTEIVTLPPSTCAAMNHALAASGRPAQADCRAIHGFYGTNHQPLPAGTIAKSAPGLFGSGTAYASAAYYRWAWYDYECSILGCIYWKVTLSEDGVANGSNVWQWSGAQCTPSGVSTWCSWKGYYYNGGGWPTYAMQFGENSCTGVIVSGSLVCVGHGIRRWIDDSGNGGSVSYF